MSWKCWKLFPILLGAGVTLLHATPTITSVSGCPNGPNVAPQITAGVTAGTPFPNGFPFCIYGSFTVGNSPFAVWQDTASGATFEAGPANSNITPTYIQMFLPASIIAAVAVPGHADPVVITVSEGANTATSGFQVNPPLSAKGAFNGTVGKPLTVTLYSFGTPPYANSFSNGSAPPGMNAFPTTSPAWSGTPTQAGTFSFAFIVTDAYGTQAAAEESIAITLPPLLIANLSPLPGGQVGVAYSDTFSATGGAGPPYAFSVYKGTLPQGNNADSGRAIERNAHYLWHRQFHHPSGGLRRQYLFGRFHAGYCSGEADPDDSGAQQRGD